MIELLEKIRRNIMFENIAITSVSILFVYLFTIAVFVGLWQLSKHKVSFSKRVLFALFMGLLLGSIFQGDATIIRPVGQIYVRLIMMIVIPLVFTSIIKSFTNLQDITKVRSIGLRSLFWLLLTTAIATSLALVVATVFQLGSSFDVSNITYIPREVVPIEQVIINLIPSNIVAHMAGNQMIPVILFALAISIAMLLEGRKNPEKVAPFKQLVDSAQDIMVRLTKMVIRFTPYGVFALIANAAGRNNLETLQALALYILVFYGVMILHFVVVHLGLIAFVGRLNPVRFLKNIYPAQVVGFTSQSSYGTLPVTIDTLTRRNGVHERVASFVGPLGANVGMNACGGMFPAFVAVITANAFGLELVLADYLIIVLTTVIASIGIAGVPGIASIAATVVLVSIGLPLEGIGLVIGVDALVDMGRTALNITGTMVSATLTAIKEKDFDYEVFNEDKVVQNTGL